MRRAIILLLLLPVISYSAVLSSIDLSPPDLFIKLSEKVPYKVAYDRNKAIIWVRLKKTVKSKSMPDAIEGKGIVDEVWIYQTTKDICDVFFFLKRQDIDYTFKMYPPAVLKITLKYKPKPVKKPPRKKEKKIPKKKPEEKKEIKKEEKKAIPPDLELIEDARKLIKMRNFDMALDYIYTFLKNYPGSIHYPDAYFLLGEIYLTLGKKTRERNKILLAIDAFRNFVNYYPYHKKAKEAYVKLAEAYTLIKFYPEAIGILKFVLKKYRKTEVVDYAMITMARVLFEMEKYERALETLRKFIRSFPKSIYLSEAYYVIASCYYKIGHYKKAVKAFSQAYKKWPHYIRDKPEYAFYMGDTYYHLKKFKRARKFFYSIVTFNPGSAYAPKAMVKIGDTYVKESKLKKALNAYSEVLRKYPKTEGEIIATIRMADLAISVRGGGRLLKKGIKLTPLGKMFAIVPWSPPKKKISLEKAFYYEPFLNPIESLSDLLKRDLKYPLDQIVKIKLGVGYLTFGDYERAIDVFSDFLKRVPFSRFKDLVKSYLLESLEKDIESNSRRGMVWKVVADDIRFSEEIKEIDKAGIYFKIGESYLNLGFLRKARDYFLLSMAKAESKDILKGSLLRIAEISYVLGDFDIAEDFSKEILDRYPKTPEENIAKNLLALLMYKTDRFKKAISYFKLLDPKKMGFFSLYAYGVSLEKSGNYTSAMEIMKGIIDKATIKKGVKVPYVVEEAFILYPTYAFISGRKNIKKDIKAYLSIFPSSNETGFALFLLSMVDRKNEEVYLKKLESVEFYKELASNLLRFIELKRKIRRFSEE